MFSFSFKKSDNYSLLSLEGSLSISSAEKFRKSVNEFLSDNSTDLIIDLENLTYIDSLGIGILFEIHKKVCHENKKVILFGLCYDINKIFELIGITKMFNITKTFEGAKNYLRGNDVKTYI